MLMSKPNSHQHQKPNHQTLLQILAHIPAIFGLSEFFRLTLQNEHSSALISLIIGCLGSLIFHLYLEVKVGIPNLLTAFYNNFSIKSIPKNQNPYILPFHFLIMKFKIRLEKDEDGMIVATVPSLPGCISQGKTEKSALKNIKEAIKLHLNCLAEDGIPITQNGIYKEAIVEVSA